MVTRENFKPRHQSYKVDVTNDDTEANDPRPLALHVSLHNQMYSGAAITKGMEEAGYQVHQMNWQDIKYNLWLEGMEEVKREAKTDISQTNIAQRWVQDYALSGLRSRLVNYVAMNKPDLVFLHIQNEGVLDAETCALMTAHSKTVLYNFDCRDYERSKWMYDLAPHLSLIAFSNQEDVDNLKALGYSNSFVLQSAASLDIYKPVAPSPAYPEICFIGGNYKDNPLSFPLAKERQDMIAFLKETYGDRFCSYGGGQEQSRYIRPEEENLIYSSAKIIIGQNNFLRPLYQSDRIWRAMAAGAFVISQWFEGIDDIFVRGEHVDWWTDLEELKRLIDWYLAHDSVMKIISHQGMEFVREHHTWRNRIETLKQHLYAAD